MKHLWRTHHNISEEVCAAVCVGSLQNVTLQCFNGFLCLSLYVSEIRKGDIGRIIYLYRKSCMHLLHKILFNLILVETIPDDWFESARFGRRWWRFVSFCQCQRSRTSTNLDGRWQKWDVDLGAVAFGIVWKWKRVDDLARQDAEESIYIYILR